MQLDSMPDSREATEPDAWLNTDAVIALIASDHIANKGGKVWTRTELVQAKIAAQQAGYPFLAHVAAIHRIKSVEIALMLARRFQMPLAEFAGEFEEHLSTYEFELQLALAKIERIPALNLDGELSGELLTNWNVELARQFNGIPVGELARTPDKSLFKFFRGPAPDQPRKLHFAIADPCVRAHKEAIESALGAEVIFCIADCETLTAVLKRCFPGSDFQLFTETEVTSDDLLDSPPHPPLPNRRGSGEKWYEVLTEGRVVGYSRERLKQALIAGSVRPTDFARVNEPCPNLLDSTVATAPSLGEELRLIRKQEAARRRLWEKWYDLAQWKPLREGVGKDDDGLLMLWDPRTALASRTTAVLTVILTIPTAVLIYAYDKPWVQMSQPMGPRSDLERLPIVLLAEVAFIWLWPIAGALFLSGIVAWIIGKLFGALVVPVIGRYLPSVPSIHPGEATSIFRCPHPECGNDFSVRDELLGTEVICPSCSGIVSVPKTSNSPAGKIQGIPTATLAYATVSVIGTLVCFLFLWSAQREQRRLSSRLTAPAKSANIETTPVADAAPTAAVDSPPVTSEWHRYRDTKTFYFECEYPTEWRSNEMDDALNRRVQFITTDAEIRVRVPFVEVRSSSQLDSLEREAENLFPATRGQFLSKKTRKIGGLNGYEIEYRQFTPPARNRAVLLAARGKLHVLTLACVVESAFTKRSAEFDRFLQSYRPMFNDSAAVVATSTTSQRTQPGIYQDPKGRFTCRPPPGWTITENREDPRSRVQFRSGASQISIIAREMESTVFDESVRNGISQNHQNIVAQVNSKGGRAKHMGAVWRDVEGTKAVQSDVSIESPNAQQIRFVRFKRDGRDHSITLTVQSTQISDSVNDLFELFLRDYNTRRGE